MSKETKQQAQIAKATVISDGVSYTPVATVVPSSLVLDQPVRVVPDEFRSLPETQKLSWQDDFFDDDDVVAVFDFDYETMESYYSSLGWVSYAATFFYQPLFWIATFAGAPCYLRKNVSWSVKAQHVAITRDGIRFVRNRRRTCWGNPCTDAGKSTKNVPFDMITDVNVEEPAGNTCLCIENVLSTVNIDTASSGGGHHELQIRGLKDPHAFKKLVWCMKRCHSDTTAAALVPRALDIIDRDANDREGVSSILRDIRDELRQNNALLQTMKQGNTSKSNASQDEATVSATAPPTNPEIV